MLTSFEVSASVSKKDLEQTQQQVQKQSLMHKRLQAKATEISLELAKISQEMVKKATLIQKFEDKRYELEKDLLVLQKELEEANANLLKEEETLSLTLYALQNLALKPTESLFVQPLTPVEIIRSAMLLRKTVPFLAEEAEIIKANINKIADKKKLIESQVAKIDENKEKIKKQHVQMKALATQRAKMRKSIEVKSAETKAKDIKELLIKIEKERIAREKRERLEKERLEKERKRIEAQRKKLEKERLEKARQERLIIKQSRAERDLQAKQRYLEQQKLENEQQKLEEENAQLAARDDLIKLNREAIKEIGKKFENAKGRISRPARGPIVVSYGQETTKGVTSKGITIKTLNNAQVISPFDGSVIFAEPFRGYGNIIIIEHGNGYMSLMTGLESITSEIGQMLLAGEPIGTMPDTGTAELYVELRKDKKTLNPAAWMAE